MAGAQPSLLNRSGRFFARLAVPKDLRALVGKTDLRAAAFGPDRKLPGAVAQLQHRKIAPAAPANPVTAPARYPLAPDQIALSHPQQRIAFDGNLRQECRCASRGHMDDLHVADLRAGIAGRLGDNRLQALIGEHVERLHRPALRPDRMDGVALPMRSAPSSQRRWRAL